MLVREARALLRPATGNTKVKTGCWGLSTDTCDKHCPDNPRSTCHKANCYAQRNQYVFPTVAECHRHRLEATEDPMFVTALSTLLWKYKGGYFRFFDSGDFPNLKVARDILKAARLNPDTKIYIPSKKYRLLRTLQALEPVPSNVCIRPGCWLIDPPVSHVEHMIAKWGRTSVVMHEPWLGPFVYNDKLAVVCPYKNGLRCTIDCAVCWDPATEVVIYPWH